MIANYYILHKSESSTSQYKRGKFQRKWDHGYYEIANVNDDDDVVYEWKQFKFEPKCICAVVYIYYNAID
jgi:hypothetical protein